MRYPIIAFVVLLAAFPTGAGDHKPNSDLGAIAAQPETEVIRKREGETDVVILKRGGVEITQTCGKDGKCSTLGLDRSGHMAVGCVAKILMTTKAMIDTCFPGQYQDLRQKMVEGLAATTAFTVAHSLRPTSNEEIEEAHRKVDATREEQMARRTPEQRELHCKRALGWVQRMESTSEKFMEDLSSSLSVPRPVVTNPCF